MGVDLEDKAYGSRKLLLRRTTWGLGKSSQLVLDHLGALKYIMSAHPRAWLLWPGWGLQALDFVKVYKVMPVWFVELGKRAWAHLIW